MHFLRHNDIWLTNAYLENHRPVDVTFLYKGHSQLHNKRAIHDKLNEAVTKIQTDNRCTEEQNRLINSMKENDYRFTVVNKTIAYTDGVNPTVKTEGLVVQVKKPYFEISREIFAMVDKFDPKCLGGGIRIMVAGTGKALG